MEQTKAFGLELKKPKTEKSIRQIPVGEMLMRELRQHKETQEQAKLDYGEVYEDNNLVCADEIGRYMKPANFSRHFGYLLAKAGVRHVRLHDMRHTHLSELEPHVSLKTLSRRAGHSTIQTTGDIYVHPNVEDGRIAATVFDELLAAAAERQDPQTDETSTT